METPYDKIGKGYVDRRVADPRIEKAIQARLGVARRVLNIGAGTGSYEPRDRDVLAVEPSMTMIAQRKANAAPVAMADAEQLPFPSGSFDLSMAVLTLHHWPDWKRGLAEAARVSGGNVLLLTWIGFTQPFWLTDYFPDIHQLDAPRFPSLDALREVLGYIEVIEVPIPHDCSDGFLCAYWRRPAAYLDQQVRRSISTFSLIGGQERGLKELSSDLSTGRWHQKYGELLQLDSRDYGYRLIHAGGLRSNSQQAARCKG